MSSLKLDDSSYNILMQWCYSVYFAVVSLQDEQTTYALSVIVSFLIHYFFQLLDLLYVISKQMVLLELTFNILGILQITKGIFI